MIKFSAFKLACIASIITVVGSAQATLFYGQDIGAGFGQARPNSDAAHTAFMLEAAGFGTIITEDFESQAIGNPGFTNLGNGLSLQLNNVPSFGGITNDPQNAIAGYNTTLNGRNYLSMTSDDIHQACSSLFTFDEPTNFFGAYFTGVGTVAGLLKVSWNDGTDHEVVIPGAPTGGCEYFGFTGTGKVSSVRISIDLDPTASLDSIGIDDIQFSQNAVPEPASLSALSLGGLALLRRRNIRTRGEK